MDEDKKPGRVTRMKIYERVPERGEWFGPMSLLCLRVETEGKPRELSPSEYALAVFCGIENAPPRKLSCFCETGCYLLEQAADNQTRHCFSLPSFDKKHVELYSDQLNTKCAKKYIFEIYSKIKEEFPEATIEGAELLD